MSKNRAFVQYDKRTGRVIPGTLITSYKIPAGGYWYEVYTDICCDPDPLFGNILGKKKAFIQYSASGDIVPGSLVITEKLPRPGIWKQVYINICCTSTTTSTSTSTTSTTTSTTSTTTEEPTTSTTTSTTSTTSTTTTTTAEPLAFILEFDNIANAPVANPYDVNDWNTFFYLPDPYQGSAFSSVLVVGNEVRLFPTSNIKIANAIFYSNNNLIRVDDQVGCVEKVETYVFYSCNNLLTVNLPQVLDIELGGFSYCQNLTSISLPSVLNIAQSSFEVCSSIAVFDFPNAINVGETAFGYCTSATNFNLPSCTNLGSNVSLDDSVFALLSPPGIVATATFNSSLQNAQGPGVPDSDIIYLQSNNPGIVITYV